MQNLFWVSLIHIWVWWSRSWGFGSEHIEKRKDFYGQNCCPNGDTLSNILRIAANLTYLQKIHLVINYLFRNAFTKIEKSVLFFKWLIWFICKRNREWAHCQLFSSRAHNWWNWTIICPYLLSLLFMSVFFLCSAISFFITSCLTHKMFDMPPYLLKILSYSALCFEIHWIISNSWDELLFLCKFCLSVFVLI